MDHRLAHEHIRAALRGHEAVGILGVGTHEDDSRPRQFLPDVPRQFDTVQSGHDQVCDHEVRPLAVHDGEGLLTICRLTNDPHVGRWCEEVADDLAILRRIIDDDYGQRTRPLLARSPSLWSITRVRHRGPLSDRPARRPRRKESRVGSTCPSTPLQGCSSLEPRELPTGSSLPASAARRPEHSLRERHKLGYQTPNLWWSKPHAG